MYYLPILPAYPLCSANNCLSRLLDHSQIAYIRHKYCVSVKSYPHVLIHILQFQALYFKTSGLNCAWEILSSSLSLMAAGPFGAAVVLHRNHLVKTHYKPIWQAFAAAWHKLNRPSDQLLSHDHHCIWHGKLNCWNHSQRNLQHLQMSHPSWISRLMLPWDGSKTSSFWGINILLEFNLLHKKW